MTRPRFVLMALGLGWLAIAIACGGGGNTPRRPPRNKPAAPTYSSGRTASTTSRRREAWIMAQMLLERYYLRSPSTADYGSAFGGDYQDPDDCVRDLGDGKFLVEAWVDAENAFGAIVRTNFLMKIEDLGDGQWQVLGQPAMAPYPEVPDYVDMRADESAAPPQPAITEEQREEAIAIAKAKDQAKEARAQAIEDAKWRDWRSDDGKFTIRAKFVRAKPDVVTLEKEDGTTIDVPTKRLSEADRDFIVNRRWLRAAPGVVGSDQ